MLSSLRRMKWLNLRHVGRRSRSEMFSLESSSSSSLLDWRARALFWVRSSRRCERAGKQNRLREHSGSMRTIEISQCCSQRCNTMRRVGPLRRARANLSQIYGGRFNYTLERASRLELGSHATLCVAAAAAAAATAGSRAWHKFRCAYCNKRNESERYLLFVDVIAHVYESNESYELGARVYVCVCVCFGVYFDGATQCERSICPIGRNSMELVWLLA